MSEVKPFWMVYGVGQGAPTYQHPSPHAAKTEAERLARSYPGKTFVILEAIATVRKCDVEVTLICPSTRADLHDDIPF